MAEGFEVAEAYLAVKADDAGLRDQVTAAVQTASEGQDINIRLGVDGAALRERIDAEVGAASGEHVHVGLDVDGDGLREKVHAEAESARATVPIDVDVHDNGAVTKLAAIDAAAREAGDSARNSGGGFSLGAVGMGTMLTAALALAPALAALPAMFAGIGGALATLKLGFGDVAKALQDHAAVSTAAGQSSAQLAATEFSNSVAIRNAQQTIVDAKNQAAIGAQNSAAAVIAAQQSLADAERAAGIAAQNSADQVAAAQQRVTQAAYSTQQAEQSLTNALYSEKQAQQALTQSRQDAANQLQDAKNAAADASLSEQAAALNLAKAQQALTAAQGNSLLSPLQLKEAQLQLAQAQQQVTDAHQRSIEATQKANETTKAGVDGAPAVVSAQHAAQMAAEATAAAQHNVTVAAQGQADAQHALAVAQRDQANQATASAEQTAKAQDALTTALRNADQQRIASTEQVTKAEQALKDMQTQQRLAAAASAAASAGAADKFQQDMSKMTPAGQAFTKELLGMKGAFDGLKSTAQTSMLPGFTKMLQDSSPLLPIFRQAVQDTGGALGSMAAQFGATFQDPAFQKSLSDFLNSVTGGFQQFTSAIDPMVKSIVDVGVKAKPITDAVAKAIHLLMTSGLPAFFEGLVGHAGNAAQGIGALMGLLNNLLGPLGDLIGAISGALGPGIAALAGPLGTVIGQLVGALTPAITALTPFITALGQGIGTLLTGAVTALLPSLVIFINDFVKILDAVAPLIDPVAKLVSALLPLVSLPLTIGAAILDALMPALLPLIDAVVKLGTWISDHLTPLLHGLGDAVGTVASGIKTAIGDAIGFVKDHFDGVVSFVGGLGARFLQGTVGLWDWLKVGFKDVINWLIDRFNFFIDKINGVTGGLSDVWSWTGAPTVPKINDIPKLATGGILTAPGFVDVGDHDRERIFLPKGASVVPLPKPIQPMRNATTGKTPPTITINYHGTQHPTPEQRQIMYRDLALAVR